SEAVLLCLIIFDSSECSGHDLINIASYLARSLCACSSERRPMTISSGSFRHELRLEMAGQRTRPTANSPFGIRTRVFLEIVLPGHGGSAGERCGCAAPLASLLQFGSGVMPALAARAVMIRKYLSGFQSCARVPASPSGRLDHAHAPSSGLEKRSPSEPRKGHGEPTRDTS